MPYIGKSPTGSGVRQRFHFTASGGETSLSGADDNSKTLKFTDGEFLDVYLNGVLLVQGTDYGVGTANTINGLSALTAGQIVEIIVYDIFNVAKINSEAIRARHYFTASGSETSIGTSQIAGLSFAANADIDVSLNGVTLVAGTDYNTTTANTIGGLSALSASDVVEIVIYEKFQLADTVSKASGGTFNGPVTFAGDVTGAVQEYFEVVLTTAQTGLTDDSLVVVDFGGSGTVKHDTKSKFDTSNDAYEFASADGVYLISFSVGVRSDLATTEEVVEAGAVVEFSADNFSSTITDENIEFGSAHRGDSTSTGLTGSTTLVGTRIYKNTAAGRKIRIRVYGNTTGSSAHTFNIEDNIDDMMGGPTFSGLETTRCTRLTVTRIA